MPSKKEHESIAIKHALKDDHYQRQISILLPKRYNSPYCYLLHSIIHINIHPLTAIEELLQSISKNQNCETHHFNLYHVRYNKQSNDYFAVNLVSLNGKHRLFDHGITYKTPLHFKWKTLKLFVETFEKQIEINDIKYDSTTNDIIEKCGITSNYYGSRKYKLLYKNQILEIINPSHVNNMKGILLYGPPGTGKMYKPIHAKGWNTLYQYKIPQNAVLKLSCYYNIYIPNKQPLEIEIDKTTTIGDLEQKICDERNISLHEFNLVSKYGVHCVSNDKFDYLPSDILWEIQHDIGFEWAQTNIYIITSKTQKIRIFPFCTFNSSIKSIKELFSSITCIFDTAFRLFWNDQELKDGKTLRDYHIPRDAEIKLEFEITIVIPNINKQNISITVDPFVTITDLKQEISDKINVTVDKFALYCMPNINRKYLLDDMTLKECGRFDGDFLYLVYLSPSKMDIISNLSLKKTPNWTAETIRISVGTLDLTEPICCSEMRLTDSVRQIKLFIQQKFRIYHKQQRLILNGYELDDSITMKELCIDNVNGLCPMFYVMVEFVSYLNELLIDDFVTEIDDDDETECDKIKELFKTTSHVNDVYVKLDEIYKIKQNYKHNQMIFDGLLSIRNNKKEAMLFHGTSLEKVKIIINNGFNRDFNKRHVYGKGVYLTNIAYLAAAYSQQKTNEIDEDKYVMLCCRTYIGDSTIGRYSMKQSELYKEDRCTQYDSFVDNLDNPTIFVINRDYHSIPCYLIVFSIHDDE